MIPKSSIGIVPGQTVETSACVVIVVFCVREIKLEWNFF